MAHHSLIYTNRQVRKLLGQNKDNFILSVVKRGPAKTKNKIKINGDKVTIFCDNLIAKGYLTKK